MEKLYQKKSILVTWAWRMNIYKKHTMIILMYMLLASFFYGILSHYTQPGKIFADEITDKLKVIACIEKPNMIHTEMLENRINNKDLKKISGIIELKEEDALIILWGPKEDIPTALETVEERCQMAFEGVPNETRKALDDGTTIFERVLPGADRMYPDTDSAPIPIKDENIENIRKALPIGLNKRMEQLKKWKIPEDCYYYILRNNLMPLLER